MCYLAFRILLVIKFRDFVLGAAQQWCAQYSHVSPSAASSKSEGSQQWPEHVSKKADEKKDVARPGRPVVRAVAMESVCVCGLVIVCVWEFHASWIEAGLAIWFLFWNILVFGFFHVCLWWTAVDCGIILQSSDVVLIGWSGKHDPVTTQTLNVDFTSN